MSFHSSIDKRVKRIAVKVNNKYLDGRNRGKSYYYYYYPTFWSLYLQRIFWLLLSLATLKKSTYKTFYSIITTGYFPHLMHPVASENNRLKEIIRVLFGYRYFYLPNLYPAYSGRFILNRKKISLKKETEPLVSIVIPVYNNISYTYNCLLSIQNNVSEATSYEVIVIDDCSTDVTPDFFRNNTENIVYIQNQTNLGYLKSNNKAIKNAKGKYICLLNNDTEVHPQWLETLVDLIQSSKKIGAVGSKLIYPNNVLQEAGGIIFSDASGANFGRMDNLSKPQYNFIREVDYCSAASLLFRKEDFEHLGGFDEQFAPAYYEDTDLCFAIRNILQKKVMYQPLSVVTHFEGISSGKEVKEGSVKHYQAINREKFLHKWSIFIYSHDSPENSKSSYRRLIPSKKTILMIDWSMPTFDKDSGSLRLFRIIKIIKSLGFHIIFAPGNSSNPGPYYYSSLIQSGVEIRTDLGSSCSADHFTSICLHLKVQLIWICKPDLNILYREKILALKLLKPVKWIYDSVDLHHLRMMREAELVKENQLDLIQAEEMKKIEIEVSQIADISITVTEKEKVFFDLNQAKRVLVVPNVHIPVRSGEFQPFGARSGLLFIGGYYHNPNVDAVLWLINEIMPVVWKDIPDLPVYLLGSHPTPEVLKLSAKNVFVPGYIQDVSSFFFNSRVFVAPLRYGAGMKGKLGQSFEYQLPIVSTSIGAEGMNLENEKQLLIADDTASFASHIVRLYSDQTLWNKLSAEALTAISKYSESSVRNTVKELFKELLPLSDKNHSQQV